ncbi:hypothetical protein Nepgr_015673 [Nepenthes gracilis]|uniref:Uncharacterized protein n=1 Tax=Nepenthes gracilis TaxID=150966 RepID=A0AAD3SNN6_NEPGR|nr:hypothetical protein Nepgr_015673 [Nepenthes gracilis]
MRSNSVCLLLIVVMVAFSMHTLPAQCRKLSPTIRNCNDGAAGIVSYAVSANNSSSIDFVLRSMRFVLASGPSKKGAGH